MKRVLLMVALILAFTVSTWGQTTNYNIFGRPTADWFSRQESTRNIPLQWMRAVDPIIGASSNAGTGDRYYVDSNVAVEGDGSSWTNAKDTLDEAVALCTANNGDIIYVASGHNEGWSAVDSADLDVAGITIIGCGVGTDMPRFDYDDTDPEVVIGAANIKIYNLAFYPSVTAVVHAIEIEADADGSVISGCWFMNGEASGTDEFIDAIQPAALADNITVVGCTFESYGGAGANTGIDMTAGVLSDWKIGGNYFNGDYAEAPIYSDNDVHLRAWIEGNICQNTNAGNYGIEFGGAATGVLVGNYVYTNAVATAIDPGSLSCFGNLIINTIDLSAYTFPPVPAIGTVTAGSAEDILKKMYYGADGTDAYPATVANDSTMAKIMAKGSTATASTYSNATDSLEMLSDKLGGFAGTAGAGAGESAYADMVLAQTDLDAILADTAAVDTESEVADLGSTLVDNIVSAVDANGVLIGAAIADTSDPVDIAEVADNSILSNVLTDDGDTSDYDRRLSSLERISMWQQVQMAYGNATPGYAHPVAYWFVDPAIGASGDGKTPFTCFATIDEAITASSNSVEDFIIVWDYSGSAGTITINKSWIHLLGMVGSAHPYPRIAATTGHGITLSNGAGRIEIAGFTIGAQSTKAGIGLDSGAASQVYIHDCHFGIDGSSACQEGIYVASGADAVDMVVEKCEFKTAITQQGIEIAGNATWGRIRNNLFIGCTASDAYPAIDISGSAVGIAIEENRIGGGADDGAGWGITLSAGSAECWINNNYANDGGDAVSNNPFLEGGTANGWGMNYKDIRATIPD